MPRDFQKGIDAVIRQAMARGECENLPGQGRPVDLSAYFNTPEDLRVAYALLKGANVLPVEVEILQEIAALKEKLQVTNNPDEKVSLEKRIRDLRLKFDTMLDRVRQQRNRR